MSIWNSQKKTVLEAVQQMAQKGLVVGTSGNVSMRVNEPGGRQLLAITPNNRYYDLLYVDDIGIDDFEGECVERELTASIETMLHIGIYKARKKVNAVIHTHPIFGSILSVIGVETPLFSTTRSPISAGIKGGGIFSSWQPGAGIKCGSRAGTKKCSHTGKPQYAYRGRRQEGSLYQL